MSLRRTLAKRTLILLLAVPALASCSAGHTTTGPRETPSKATPSPASGGRSLSAREIATAIAAARKEIRTQSASISSATAVARRGIVRQPNTGHRCPSGHLLKIKLIGDFPHTLTTGLGNDPASDSTVRAMIVTADARSGKVCLVGVQTAEAGPVEPLRHATTLNLR